jgi:RNA polymerase sigma factor (sigma-70 family)
VDDLPGRTPDAELVAAARADRGRDAFAGLVSRHWPAAVALAARVLGSPDLAADAAQEAAIAALVSLDRLREPGRFGAWYCGITLNVARRWARQLRAERPGPPPERASDQPGPAEQAELADLAAAVRAAVAQLPDGQRRAVFLFYLQGLTHREVAAELAISVGAVKARLHQARASLTPALTPLITTPEENVMMTTAGGQAWAEVAVTEIRRSDGGDPLRRQHVMVLAEPAGPGRLPIWIGPAEAYALALSLESQEAPRPLTYQLAARLLDAATAAVSEVRITRLAGQIFYAVVVVDGPAGRQEVDARPSDAVNLALVTGARILADPALLADPLLTAEPQWQEFRPSTAELAAEAQQRLREVTQSPHSP